MVDAHGPSINSQLHSSWQPANSDPQPGHNKSTRRASPPEPQEQSRGREGDPSKATARRHHVLPGEVRHLRQADMGGVRPARRVGARADPGGPALRLPRLARRRPRREEGRRRRCWEGLRRHRRFRSRSRGRRRCAVRLASAFGVLCPLTIWCRLKPRRVHGTKRVVVVLPAIVLYPLLRVAWSNLVL